jgi:hypothetical protein
MRPKTKSKNHLAEEKLVDIWNKIGIASLLLRDGRQVEVHDGRFVFTIVGTMPSAVTKVKNSGEIDLPQ